MVEAKVKLDLGCGDRKGEGWIGIDINSAYNPDIIYDLNMGLPFFKYYADLILLNNSLEHIHDPMFLLKECHRVLKEKGEIEIIIPNCQWFPLICLSFFCDIHRLWNWRMRMKKNRGIHYTLWTPYTIELALGVVGFKVIRRRGFYLSKSFYIKAVK